MFCCIQLKENQLTREQLERILAAASQQIQTMPLEQMLADKLPRPVFDENGRQICLLGFFN